MEFETNHEIIVRARRNATGAVWDYIAGASESETAMRRNRQALDSIALRPRVLRDVTDIDLSTTLLGQPSSMPLFLAPMASLQLMTPDGAIAADTAAERTGVLNVLSGHTLPTLEEVAANTPHPKFFQIYVRGDRSWTEELLGRVKASGYKALTVTVDAPVYSNRERQLVHNWTPPTRRNAAGREYLAALSWDIFDEISEIWGGPVILKGIACPEDAEMAVAHGAAVVYVTNHGGRQLDHDRGTISILGDIVAAVAGRAEIWVDGGFVRGTDIIKAIALGANAVGIGKMQAFALTAGGADAVENCLEILRAELTIAMGLLGARKLSELDGSYLAAARPVGPCHEMSAFPHLPGGGRLT